jgi:hypothetical protein
MDNRAFQSVFSIYQQETGLVFLASITMEKLGIFPLQRVCTNGVVYRMKSAKNAASIMLVDATTFKSVKSVTKLTLPTVAIKEEKQCACL